VNLNATLFAQMVVFFILWWVVAKFVWPPLVKALDERATKVADGLAAAERGKADLESAKKNALSKHYQKHVTKVLSVLLMQRSALNNQRKKLKLTHKLKQRALLPKLKQKQSNKYLVQEMRLELKWLHWLLRVLSKFCVVKLMQKCTQAC